MRVRRTGSSRLRMAVAYDHAQTRHARRRRADRRRVRAILRDTRLSPEASHPRGERRLPRRGRRAAGRLGRRARRTDCRLPRPGGRPRDALLRPPGSARRGHRLGALRARAARAAGRLQLLGVPGQREGTALLREARLRRGRVHRRFPDRGEDPGRALPVDVRRLADGLWRWTAPHPNAANWPDWVPPVPPEVGCVYYEAPDAVVLIDPLLPAGEEEEFLAYLDRDVERLGLPVSILLTAAWHERSAAILRERYRADNRVPESVEACRVEGAPEEQLAYFIRPHRALVVAEILVGDGDGGLALSPSPALADRAALDHSLQTIAELPVELVLVSHGEPVLDDAKARMAEALAGGQ